MDDSTQVRADGVAGLRPEPGSDGALEDAEAAVEADIAELDVDLATVVAQRDDYLDSLRRLQADFENFKKQSLRRNTEVVAHAARSTVEKLLPVLDAFDGALAHGADDAKPIYDVLMDVLEKEGLSVVFPAGERFDPNTMEAVMHEPAEEGDEPGEVVTGVLRTGYLWKGRVLRPALVKVRG